MSKNSDAEVIELDRQGLFAYFRPGLPGRVLAKLQHPGREFRVGGERGFESLPHDGRLYQHCKDGCLETLAGFVPRIRRELTAAGFRLVDTSPEDPAAHYGPEIEFRPADVARPALVAMLLGERGGQIEYDARADQIRVIHQICGLFNQRIAVVAKNRDDAYRLASSLRAVGQDSVALIARGLATSEARIWVTTIGSLDPYFPAVVILASAEQALATQAAELLNKLDGKHVYGLRRQADRYGARRELQLEGLLGPILGRVGDASPRIPVSVDFADWRCKDRDCGEFGLEWKRHGIWRNDERNDAVAAIARGLVEGDEAKLWEHGLFFETASTARPPDRARTVAILVESLEHARALQQRLPGWRIASDRSDDSSHETGAADDVHRAVVTTLRMKGILRLNVDVLIRADGTPWTLHLPAIDHVLRDHAAGLKIVDMRDQFDQTASLATEERLAAYQDKSWPIRNAPPPADSTTPSRRFLRRGGPVLTKSGRRRRAGIF